MSIVNAAALVTKARREGYAVPALNTQGGSYDVVRAIVETAAEEKAPVILMAYEKNLEYYGYEGFVASTTHLVQRTGVNACLHLDHASTIENVNKALSCGFTSVMIDYSTRPLAENIQVTLEAIRMARPRTASVEAEIGELQRTADGTNQEPKNLVDPEEVRTFLAACRPDMLAIGIGNAHGFYKGEPHIRIDLLERVQRIAGDLPLVLHGTTGIPDEVVRQCIRSGVAKVNLGTMIRYKYLDYYRKGLEGAVDHQGHSWRIARYAMEQLKNDVRQVLRLCMADGKA